MDNLIPRYHLLMKKEDFLERKRKGVFNGFYGPLSFCDTEPTLERFLPMFHKVGQPWAWSNIAKYRDMPKLNKHFKDNHARLVHLLDDVKIVGYSLLVDPDSKTKEEILGDYSGLKIAEIENLGLFPNQAGKGRGFKFFEMMLTELFKNNDCVYWSMTSTNHSGLFDFYTNKIGMTHIKTTYAPSPVVEKVADYQDKRKTA